MKCTALDKGENRVSGFLNISLRHNPVSMLYLTKKVFLVLYRVFSLDYVLRFIISLII